MLSLRKLVWIARRPRAAWSQISEVRALARYRHSVSANPVMPEAALGRLQALLGQARLVVEYGAGGSTLLGGQLGVEIVSVEGDRNFAAAVSQAAAAAGHTQVRVLTPDIGWTRAWSYPFDSYPTQANLARWRAYLTAPWEAIGARAPDFVLVDGRFRAACVAQSVLACLERGTSPPILLDDYVGRAGYEVVGELCELVQLWDRLAEFRIRPGVSAREAEAARERWLPLLE